MRASRCSISRSTECGACHRCRRDCAGRSQPARLSAWRLWELRSRGWRRAGAADRLARAISRRKRDGPWTTHDAVTTAVAFAIPQGMHATQVWDVVQPQVQALQLANKEEAIWLVVASTGRGHKAVAGPAAAAKAAHRLAVPCSLVDTSGRVKEAKKRYDELTTATQGGGVVQALPTRQTG